MPDGERAELEKFFLQNRYIYCKVCRGKLAYVSGGRYKCEECGREELDDFGRIKEFLDEHGPSTSYEIEKGTGVHPEVIQMYLRKGRIEIPDGSEHFIKCEKCGCNIRYGRFCPACAKQLAGNIKAVFNEEVGEQPKRVSEDTSGGKMHFLNKKK